MDESLIALRDVSRVYAAGRCSALQGVSLDIGAGDYLAVTGPSGSGKSTLLHVMCGIDLPTSGRVLFEGCAPGSPAAWRRIRSRRVGLVFQSFHLLAALTALENAQVPMFGVVASAGERRRKAQELLDRVGLAGRSGHRPGEMSGGERQRLAIARALANSPSVVLADEPTGNLDSAASASVLALLEELHRERGAALVIVTHDPAVAGRARRIVRMLDGQVHGSSDGGGA